MCRERGRASLENSSLHSDAVSSNMFFALYYSLVVCIGSWTWWCQASNPSLHSSGWWQNQLDWWCQASDLSLRSSGGWQNWSDRWGQASDCSLRSPGGWWVWSDWCQTSDCSLRSSGGWTGQTDDRHLTIYCVLLVDDKTGQTMMTGI